MSIATQQHNVPVLRFPEFVGEWEAYGLGDLLEITSASRVHKNEWTQSGVPFFRTSDVIAYFKGLPNKKAYISLELFRELSTKSGCVKKNDILITGGGSIGIPFLVKSNEPMYFKDADLLWLKNSDRLNGTYLYAFFLTPTFRKHISRITHIGTISHYTVEQAKATPIKIPSNKEQQKIASFLSSVDKKIEQLGKKKKLLEQYKKGMMQKLFAQEIRFKDDNGKDYPDWEEKKLGDISKTTTGSSNREDSAEKGEYTFFDRSSDTRASSKYLYDCEAIIVAGEGKDFPPRYFVGKFDLHQRAYATMEFGKNSGKFIYYWIYWHRSFFLKHSVGSTMPSLRMDSFTKFPIKSPNPDEQTKIANFLSRIDDKINLIETELTHAQTFKKGLLQQMFV